ncbi:MAG: DsbA family protein [Bacillota bacterium]
MSLDERIQYLEMKERHHKKLRPWYRKKWGMILVGVGLLALAALIAGTIYFIQQVKSYQREKTLAFEAGEIQKITAAIDGRGESFSLGPDDAKAQIVVFSDFACPFCKEASPMMRDLSLKYGEGVRFIFRNYPLHDNSVSLALAANCAGDQNRFWEMHDKIFERQDQYSQLDDESVKQPMKDLAKEMGLNTVDFDSCLDSKKYLHRLNDDFADAELLGLSGTPTWFINHYKVTGMYPQANFESVIEGLIAQ